MPLTDTQCRKALPAEKDYKLGDAGGLYLFVTTKGGKSWRMKYRFAGKEKRLTFGRYPEVTLAEARDRRDDARRLLRDHRDPAVEEHKRKMASHAAAGATMEKLGRAWHEAQRPRWSPTYSKKLLQGLERDVFPDLGALPLADIDGPMILRVLRKIEARGSLDSAKRRREHISAIFVYGMSEGIVPNDPAATVGKALRPIVVRGKQPALTDLVHHRRGTARALPGVRLMSIAAGNLRDRVDIQVSTSAPDGAGGSTKSWSTVATVWAGVDPVNGGEAFSQGIARNTQFYRITIRHRTDVSPANRLIFNGMPLNIRTCADPDRRREALLISAESGVAEPA